MNQKTRELFLVLARWVGAIGTFISVISLFGTYALAGLSMVGTHGFLVAWLILSMCFFTLWLVAGHLLKRLPIKK